jgi:hypothetical protein
LPIRAKLDLVFLRELAFEQLGERRVVFDN